MLKNDHFIQSMHKLLANYNISMFELNNIWNSTLL